MDHSITSRSPSGQWYPQQQQQQHALNNHGAFNAAQLAPHPPSPNANPQYQQQQQLMHQWSPVSGTTTPIGQNMHVSSPATVAAMTPGAGGGGGGGGLNSSGMLGSSSGNLWGNGLPSAQGPGGIGSGPMTPQQQQQLMMMQGMYAPQDQCCASCCGPPQGGCCGPQQSECCGPQQGGCCGPQQGGCCGPQQSVCCPAPGEPVDPFCCTPTQPGQEPGCCESVYRCFDWTFLIGCILFALTVVGFAVIMATKSQDNLFAAFNASNTAELDAALRQYVRWRNSTNSTNTMTMEAPKSWSGRFSSWSVVAVAADLLTNFEMPFKVVRAASSTSTTAEGCTPRRLLGSFGTVCMEDNMNANTFVVQLSSWTNARDTLWFLAMLYSAFTVLYAVLVHKQRHPSAAATAANEAAARQRASVAGMPSITPQQQDEFLKMTPQQQQAFMQEFHQQVAAAQEQNPNAAYPPTTPGAGCCGGDSGIEFYDTPLYEFVRMAWFVSGITAFVWTCNLFVSFWSFSSFYASASTGPLHEFWKTYTAKMNASLIVVTIFLAWPLCCFVLDLVVWLVLGLPWLVVRSTCKQGVQQYRPALPLSQLPAYIRADMFFMDFQDVKRLGFSRQSWIMLTGSEQPFFDCCEDPTVDRDPAMTQLMQQRLQWQQMTMSMMPPWMQQQQQQMMMMMGQSGMAQMGMLPPHLQQQMQLQNGSVAGAAAGMSGSGGASAAAATPRSSPQALPQAPADYPAEETGESKSHQRRRHRSAHDHRHADPLASGAAPMEQTSLGLGAGGAGGGKENSTRNRHRRRSRSRSQSKAAFESAAAAVGTGAGDASVPPTTAATGGDGAASRPRHRRRSRSRSKEAAAMGAPPLPAEGAGGEAGTGRHRRRSRSRSQSKAAVAEASASAVGGNPADTAHRHHRRHSRSREKGHGGGGNTPGKSGAAAADLDALMQL